MQKDKITKVLSKYKFLRRMQKKLLFIFLVITVCLIALIVRLTYIEQTSGERYEKIVLAQQVYDSKTLPFRRGDIVDAKGTVLATSIEVYNVILDCHVLFESTEDIDLTVAALVECFPEIEEEEVYEIIRKEEKKVDKEEDETLKKVKKSSEDVSRYIVLAKRCSKENKQQFEKMREKSIEEAREEQKKRNEEAKKSKDKDKKVEKVGKISSEGVWFETEYLRTYPYNSLAASLIGFVSAGNVGTIGLEHYYNSTLNGINGREYGYLNSDNNFERTVRKARNGYTVVSTIHEQIQSAIEKALAKYNEENTNGYVQGNGSLRIAAIAMDPRNGEVLGMAERPTFDLNNPRDMSQFTEEQLSAEKHEGDLLNELWQNFCINYTYEPGSTIKPLTVACGLETGKLNGDESYICDGVEVINGEEVHCVNRMGHGTETVQKSLMDSCNDALMQMSYAIGKEDFTEYQKLFGFGQKTGIDLPGEERGLLQDDMQLIGLATNSFGQNFNCTMIQLASAFSSLINGGKYYQPHVVKRILDEDGNVVENIKPVLLKETVSKDTSEQVKSYLYATVSEGTGNEAKVDGYSMGGKTGTAQKLPRGNGKYLVSFIGYVPQEDPQLVLYVIIDEPNVKEQAHSSYAQGVAKDILEEILPYLNIYPDEEKTQTQEDGQEPSEGSSIPEGANAPEGQGSVEEGSTPESPDTPEGQNPPEEGDTPESPDTPEGQEPPAEGGDIFEE